MVKGTVKWFDPRKGFGFVVNQAGQDVFVHYSSIDKDGFKCLRNGQVVEYEQFNSPKGLQGRGVRIIEIKPPANRQQDRQQNQQQLRQQNRHQPPKRNIARGRKQN